MDKTVLKEKLDNALTKYEENLAQPFLYSLFDFQFEYDDENEMVRVEVPVSKLMNNPIGLIHGGVFTYIADTAMGHLCAVFGERPGVSLELKTQFIRTIQKGMLKAEAYFVKKGKSIQYIECAIKDEKERLLTKTTATFMLVEVE